MTARRNPAQHDQPAQPSQFEALLIKWAALAGENDDRTAAAVAALREMPEAQAIATLDRAIAHLKGRVQ